MIFCLILSQLIKSKYSLLYQKVKTEIEKITHRVLLSDNMYANNRFVIYLIK